MKSDYFINDSRRPKGENLVYLEAMNYGYGLNDLVHPKISYNKMSSLMELEIEKFYLGKQTAKEALDNIARQLNQMIQS